MGNPLAEDLDHILEHTIGLWEELRGQNLFITGGTGFFGCWLLESFAWANDRLKLGALATVLSRSPERFTDKAPHLANHPAIRLIQGDVKSFEFPEGNFPYVIHAATESSAKLNTENQLLMFDTIVEGTQRVLEFARTHETRKFLLTSSGAVYGKQPPEITHIPEEYVGAPDMMDTRSTYGEGKRAAELLCTLYAKQYGIETKIARCFAFVGPYLPLDIHYAIGNFIRDAVKGGPIVIEGDGTPYRSYLYAADLAIWLWTILFQGESCRPYNVGSEDALTIRELADMVVKSSNKTMAVQVAKTPIPGQLGERYVPATKCAQTDLRLQQWIKLTEALQRTIK